MSEGIIGNIFFIWISYFGAPKQLLSDNRREFNNEAHRQMNEKLNIKTCTIAAEGPFSNGNVEQNNLIMAEAMEMLEDNKSEPEIALVRAVSTKNVLQNHSGQMSLYLSSI